jgi:hypothetical protein
VLLEEGVERPGHIVVPSKKEKVTFDQASCRTYNAKRFDTGRRELGATRIQSAWDKAVLYGQRADLDMYNDLPSLRQKFCVVKVWADRPQMKNRGRCSRARDISVTNARSF